MAKKGAGAGEVSEAELAAAVQTLNAYLKGDGVTVTEARKAQADLSLLRNLIRALNCLSISCFRILPTAAFSIV